MRKMICFIGAGLLLLHFAGCNNPFSSESSSNSTTVEIIVNDDYVLSGSFIKSIYDPNNDQDFRYTKYDESRSVKFTNVDPGNYRAHATPVSLNTGNWVDITVAKGDHYVITFTYYIDGYVTIGYATVPHYWWKHSVVKK